MAKYRVRCTCGKVFCSKCREEPYHLGMTCKQFKDLKNARKCRFCQKKIDKDSPVQSKRSAFKDVCGEEECVELMKKSCSKVLQCGHYCCGFKKEPQCLPCLHPECVTK